MFDFGNMKEPNGYQALLDELVKCVYAETLAEAPEVKEVSKAENTLKKTVCR